MNINKNKTRLKRFVGILIMLSVVTSLSAATAGVLRLQAYVPELVEITVSSNQDVGTLNLTLKEDNLTVGHVEERANSQTGYEVELVSKNAIGTGIPSMVAEDGSNQSLEYSIYYHGNQVVFDTTGKAIVTSATTLVSSGVTKSVSISYDGTVVDLDTGYYSDTLTFSIVPK